MAEECSLLKNCGFFKKFGRLKDLACRGFIRQYCKGPRMDECKRKQFRAEHGYPPDDDLMPSGHNIVPMDFDDVSPAGQTPTAPLPGSPGGT
jgi:hypothetical protein